MVCMNLRAWPMFRKLRVVLFSPSTMNPWASSNSTLPLPRCMVMKVGSLCFLISFTTPSASVLIFLAISLGLSFSLAETLSFFLSIIVHLPLRLLANCRGLAGLPGCDSAAALDELFLGHLRPVRHVGFDGCVVLLEVLGFLGLFQLELVQHQLLEVLFQVLPVFLGYLAERDGDFGDVFEEHLALHLLLGFLAIGDDVP